MKDLCGGLRLGGPGRPDEEGVASHGDLRLGWEKIRLLKEDHSDHNGNCTSFEELREK